MVIRIVKMTFRPDAVEAFKTLFDERKALIRNCEGCTHLELWQDAGAPHILFTYSWWQSEAHLNNYRSSHFFEDTWKRTKEKFAAKPEAWSVHQVQCL